MRVDDAREVAVIGGGFVGFSWANVFSRNGLVTKVYDSDSQALERSSERIAASFSLLHSEGVLTKVQVRDALEVVRPCANLEEALSGVDYVQECVPERLAIKQDVFAAVDAIVPPDVVIGSSVAQLHMTEIAALTKHPERCVVAHPTNPPHLIPLVEVCPGELTSDETVRSTYAFMERLGQAPIVVNREIMAYVLNRIQFALVQEAIWLALRGVASVEDIDRCVTEGLGLRWALTGPFMVEELNARSIQDSLKDYQEENRILWSDLGDLSGGYSDDDITAIAEGVTKMLGGRSHDDMMAWRDSMVLKLRALKEEHRMGL